MPQWDKKDVIIDKSSIGHNNKSYDYENKIKNQIQAKTTKISEEKSEKKVSKPFKP